MEKFEIKNRKGLKIVGEIHSPENSTGLAFVLHGLGGYKEQLAITAMVDIFLKNNYTVINFDATNSVGESEGKYENATMQLHYEDLVDVIEWAKDQIWYKKLFVLAGHSLGGNAVLEYAEEHPLDVKGVFSFAATIAGELSMEAYTKNEPEKTRIWEQTGWSTRKNSKNPEVELQLPWSHMTERMNHDLRKKASNLTMPVSIIVGENDSLCPVEHQQELFDLLPDKENKQIHVISGARHTFKEQVHLEQLKNILDLWLSKLK